MKKRITLLARVKDGEGGYGLERLPTEKNGRALRPKAPPEATAYYLRYTEGGKRRVEPVGDDIDEAYTRFLNGETRLEACLTTLRTTKRSDRNFLVAAR